MKRLRKEDLSLFRYIKDTVLREFIEKEEMVPLKLMPELSCEDGYVYQAFSDMIPSPIERGRGWVYFDCPNVDEDGYCVYSTDSCVPEFVMVSGTDAAGNNCIGTPEQSNRVKVYDDSLTVISGTEYIVDYVDGRIILDNKNIVPKYVDYYWNYVSVLDEWSTINASDVPIVVIDISGTDKTGFQLGGGKKAIRSVNLHVFTESSAQRNELVEVLYDGLYNKSAPVYSFPTGDILEFDGTFYGRKDNNKLTSLFNRTTLNNLNEIHGSMEFEDVSSRNIDLPLLMSGDSNEPMLSDLNAYRSRITFKAITYNRR